LILEPSSKFAVIAVHNARVDLPPSLVLQDGTKVLSSSPFPLDATWKDWLGTMQSHNLEACNLFLLRTATSGWAHGQLAIFGGDVDAKLQADVGGIFAFLRIVGSIEYTDAFMLAGHVEDGSPSCRHFAKTVRFNTTGGCLPWVIREADLRTAVELHRTYSVLRGRLAKSERFSRGCHALKVALEQDYASDRLHGFVRALEALILPEAGKTEKQFVSRCRLFAGPKAEEASIRGTLQEAYRMRCDIEHMHDWDRSLQMNPAAEHEHIARWRTRQMEALACSAYRKILSDPNLQLHFRSDATIEAFWKKPDAEIRSTFGNACNISQLKIVKKYSSNWRADPSEWPPEVFENLQPRAKSA
jgi:hypothetical protein